MKRIGACLFTLLVFFSMSFIFADTYADSEESSAVKLPQGVKLADEGSAVADPSRDDEGSGVRQEAEAKPVKALNDTDRLDVPEDAAVSRKKDKEKEPSSKKDDLAELNAYVDKSTITIGGKVTYTLEIDADNDLKVEFPSYMSGLGGFAVKDFGRDEKRIGRSRTRKKQWYLLDTYTTGSYVIPGQNVKITLANGQVRVLRSPQIFVEVESVIDNKDEKAGIRDIKEPLTVNAGVPIILIIAIVIVFLIAVGIISWKLYLNRIAKAKKEPVPDPHEIAFWELERIENLELVEKLRIKEYYYLVSLALRTYLENRFSLKAPEQTTEEFLESVVRSDKLKGRYINILKEYLDHCDLVKYAKFNPSRSQARSLIETTRRFIEETAEKKEESGNTVMNGDKI